MSERKVPKLRFPEFSGGWISKSLKSISNQISYGLIMQELDFFLADSYFQ